MTNKEILDVILKVLPRYTRRVVWNANNGKSDSITGLIGWLQTEIEENSGCVVNLDKPMGWNAPVMELLSATSGGITGVCGQCKKIMREYTQNGTITGDYCTCMNSQTMFTR